MNTQTATKPQRYEDPTWVMQLLWRYKGGPTGHVVNGGNWHAADFVMRKVRGAILYPAFFVGKQRVTTHRLKTIYATALEDVSVKPTFVSATIKDNQTAVLRYVVGETLPPELPDALENGHRWRAFEVRYHAETGSFVRTPEQTHFLSHEQAAKFVNWE